MRKVGRPKLSSIAICMVNIASLRRLADHSSPLLSQVLFGEKVNVLAKKNKHWYRVVCEWDGTVGWIDAKQFYVLTSQESQKYEQACETFALDHLKGLRSNEETIPISIGADLPHCDGINVKLPQATYHYTGQIVNLNQSRNSAKLLTKISKHYLHAPELSGGRSLLGVDASGLMQVIYKMIGLKLPRSCSEQARVGQDVGFHAQSSVGDLAFFVSESTNAINHVGMVMEDSTVMHVYGKVRIDQLDQQGLYDKRAKKYLFALKTIRRISELSL